MKEYEKTSGKLEKASGKSKSGKSDALASELNQLTSSLSSLSPMVYTTFQRLDEERLRGLKEVIVRWGTVRGDMASREGERAERAVAAIIGWETPDEVLAVGRRLGGKGGAGRSSNGPTLSSATSTRERTFFGLSSSHRTARSDRRLSSIPPGTPTNDFSPRPALRQNGSSGNINSPPSSFTGGFKSMLGRTKSTIGGAGRGRSSSNATSLRSARPEGNFDTIGEDDPRTPPAMSPPVDDEGFSVAPADRHRNPWEDPNELIPTPAQAPAHTNGASGFAQTLTSSPTASQDNLSSSPSLQNNAPRLNLAMTQQPIQETEEERQAALQKMQQTLAMPPQQPSRRATVARGRRDVRNTMFGGASEDGSMLGAAGLPMPRTTEPTEMLGSPPINGGYPNGIERPQQIARQSSISSMTSNNPFDSPGLAAGLPPSTMATAYQPGLRASIIETVNVIMRNAEIQRVQINGEIHVSLRLASAAIGAGPIHIRLTSFEQLEKIAPNPAFLAQVPDRPGEYFLNSEALATDNQKGSAKGTLLFKYQVHVPAGKVRTAAPFILEPAFSCKDGETRMILNYRVNPESPLSSISITHLSFLATFGPGVSVSNVQAKPAGGVWSPSTRRMTWNVNEMTGTEGKIIAKFVSERGEPMSPQGVQASWAVEGLLVSGLGLEVVDGQLEGGWSFEEVRKGVTTGKYLAEPTIN